MKITWKEKCMECGFHHSLKSCPVCGFSTFNYEERNDEQNVKDLIKYMKKSEEIWQYQQQPDY